MDLTNELLILLCVIVAFGQYRLYQWQKGVHEHLMRELPRMIADGIIRASRKEELLEIQADLTGVPLRELKGIGKYGENKWGF